MKSRETCPTCGTKLGPLHDRDALRRCDACQRPNPRGFRYCGFCAAPMESAAEAAERVDVAAPAGGWPSLARELVELRFYLDRGELDEAFELLAILRERFPGHPELAEYTRSPAGSQPRADTHVHRVVDAVLAGSPSLSASALPRRSVPQWNARGGDEGDDEDGKKTRAHAAVSLGTDDEEPTSRRSRPRAVESKRPAPARAKTDKHLGAVPVAKSEAAAKRGRSGASKVAAGHTVAVPTLQPAKPFEGDEEEARPTKIMNADKGLRSARAAARKDAAVDEGKVEPRAAAPTKPDKGVVRKRMLEPELAAAVKAIEPKKRTGKHAAAKAPPEPETGKKRARPVGAGFGQNVLGRLGRKGKPS